MISVKFLWEDAEKFQFWIHLVNKWRSKKFGSISSENSTKVVVSFVLFARMTLFQSSLLSDIWSVFIHLIHSQHPMKTSSMLNIKLKCRMLLRMLSTVVWKRSFRKKSSIKKNTINFTFINGNYHKISVFWMLQHKTFDDFLARRMQKRAAVCSFCHR